MKTQPPSRPGVVPQQPQVTPPAGMAGGGADNFLLQQNAEMQRTLGRLEKLTEQVAASIAQQGKGHSDRLDGLSAEVTELKNTLVVFKRLATFAGALVVAVAGVVGWAALEGWTEVVKPVLKEKLNSTAPQASSGAGKSP